MRIVPRLLPLAALAVLAVPGLAAADDAPTDNALADTQWQLAELGDEPVSGDVKTTLIIRGDGSIGGNGGCNSYGGSIEFKDASGIAIGDVFSTMMHCGDVPMAQEHAYFNALTEVTGYAFDGERLVLKDGEGNALATLVPGEPDAATANASDAQ